MTMVAPPSFLSSDPRRRQAYVFAVEAYDGRMRRRHQDLRHPLRTAELLADAGVDDDLVAAGILHDVLEDTEVDPRELYHRVGDRIAALVEAVSEDPSIDDYDDRKAALRQKIADAGRDAAIIALADKVATLDELRATGEELSPEREHHFRESLRVLQERCGELPFAAQVRDGLQALTRG
jgi:guanosine-3',5'-bis(diphosphate) 3'-pyrophosphohydrolase